MSDHEPPTVAFVFDGAVIAARRGQSVGAALTEAGVRVDVVAPQPSFESLLPAAPPRQEPTTMVRVEQIIEELQHLTAVQRQLAVQLQPVDLALDLQRQLRRGHAAHPHRLALGPFADDRCAQPGQRLHHRQRLLGVVQRPGVGAIVQPVHRLHQRLQVGPLGGQVAPGGQRDTLVHRGHPLAAQAGRLARAEVAERRGHHAQRQAVALRRQLGAQHGAGGHLVAGLGVAGQLEVRAQHAQRRVQLGPGRHRHLPALADQLGHPQLRRRHPHQAGLLGAVAQQQHVRMALRDCGAAAHRDADVGTLRVRTLPNMWNHSSCDHGVSTRLLPAGPQATAIRVWWLVDEKAVEGRDYDLAKMMPFWQLTSEQDWLICERQQKGINSSAYRPGPYSTFKEYNVEGFVQWYLKMIGAPFA